MYYYLLLLIYYVGSSSIFFFHFNLVKIISFFLTLMIFPIKIESARKNPAARKV